jgi:multimeric flavodoxin WrbA
MKVLLVCGSPHKEGCTHTALAEVAKTLQEEGIETKEVWIGNKPVGGCTACGACAKLGKCMYDDVVNEVLAEIDTYDGFIFGTPVYYASPNGSMLGFMDRLFYAGAAKMAYKPAAAVASARRGGTTATFDAMNKYFTINNMPIVGSNYWNEIHGNTAEEAAQDEEGLQTMRVLGNNMAWLLKCIQLGKEAGIAPETEKKIWTNFIR